MTITPDKVKAADFKAKGNDCFKQQDFHNAVDWFTKAIKADPTDHVLYSNRSGSYAAVSEYQMALQDAGECVRIAPNWAKGWSRKGFAEHHQEKYGDAETSYRRALELDSNNESFRDGLRSAMNAKTEEHKASGGLGMPQLMEVLKKPKFQKYLNDPAFQQSFEELITTGQFDPKKQDPRILELILCAKGEDIGEEDNTFEEAANRRRERDELDEARRKKEAQESEEAEKLRLEALKPPEQKKGESLREDGNSLYKNKLFKEAIEKYDESIRAWPCEISTYNNKAAVYIEMKDYDACEALIKETIEKRYELKAPFEKVAKLYCRLAVCYERQHKFDLAESMYEKALMEDNTRQTRSALSQLQRDRFRTEAALYEDPVKGEEANKEGNEFFNKGDFINAKKCYDEAVKRNPKDPKHHCNRATAYHKLIELPSALKDAETALKLDPNYVRAWARKGAVHFALKEYNKAMTSYQEGLQRDNTNRECMDGLNKVVITIQQQQSTGNVDKQAVEAAMRDPEIQSLMSDPQFQLILKNMQECPSRAQEYLKDPKILAGVNKLVAAGILRLG
eukprot:GHVR01190709.1.p1 GENE.GHVR01190709.1~~GHVR01190709.1.p1  ORF type:complete len:565 (+),score=146.50 GHVR01190709.1:119-1813(+)